MKKKILLPLVPLFCASVWCFSNETFFYREEINYVLQYKIGNNKIYIDTFPESEEPKVLTINENNLFDEKNINIGTIKETPTEILIDFFESKNSIYFDKEKNMLLK